MKYLSTIFVAIVLVAQFCAPSFVQAQGTTYVSNLGQTPTGSGNVGSDAWIAQAFGTGNDSGGYVLNSIQLLMNAASGNPGGFAVSLYSKTGDPQIFNPSSDFPQSSLGSFAGLDPSAGGLFTYTASGLTLSPSTFYFLVVTGTTPVAQGAYVWSAANSYTPGSNQWRIENIYYGSANGLGWVGHVRQDVFQLSINATLIPEPSITSLLFLACSMVGWHSFRKSISR